ncbi:MAG: PEP-CTERM sorting domain-containing protein [Verrucomicrobiia bacterium]
MKKTLVLATLVAFVCVSSYGQGSIYYNGFLHGVGNNYTTPGTVTYNTGIDVELFYAPASTTTAVSAIANSSSPASLTYNIATAWADIMGNMPTFQYVDGTNSPVGPAVFQSAANGGGSYNNAVNFTAANLTAGTTYTFYEVAWYTGASGQYSTLASANGNTYVGWSQAFQYTPVATTGSPPPVPALVNAALVGDYLVGGIIPEPTTIALAGLGGLSLLLFRRRK